MKTFQHVTAVFIEEVVIIILQNFLRIAIISLTLLRKLCIAWIQCSPLEKAFAWTVK